MYNKIHMCVLCAVLYGNSDEKKDECFENWWIKMKKKANLVEEGKQRASKIDER